MTHDFFKRPLKLYEPRISEKAVCRVLKTKGFCFALPFFFSSSLTHILVLLSFGGTGLFL